jgi:hypothetical protein
MALIVPQQGQSSGLATIKHRILRAQTWLTLELGGCEPTDSTLDSCLDETKLGITGHC